MYVYDIYIYIYIYIYIHVHIPPTGFLLRPQRLSASRTAGRASHRASRRSPARQHTCRNKLAPCKSKHGHTENYIELYS